MSFKSSFLRLIGDGLVCLAVLLADWKRRKTIQGKPNPAWWRVVSSGIFEGERGKDVNVV